MKKKKKNGNKIIAIVCVVLLVIAGVIFVPKLTHTCDSCGKFFVGAGYNPGAITSLFSDKEQIICKECAAEQHAIAIASGQNIKSFKRSIF